MKLSNATKIWIKSFLWELNTWCLYCSPYSRMLEQLEKHLSSCCRTDTKPFRDDVKSGEDTSLLLSDVMTARSSGGWRTFIQVVHRAAIDNVGHVQRAWVLRKEGDGHRELIRPITLGKIFQPAKRNHRWDDRTWMHKIEFWLLKKLSRAKGVAMLRKSPTSTQTCGVHGRSHCGSGYEID